MSSALASALQLTDMLQPVPGEPPMGADLREDFSPQSYYYRLRDARAEARAAERAADLSTEESPPPQEWRVVRQVASAALLEKTKDLEIAGWFTEALLRLEGLAGLAAGSQLMAGLVENFWDAGLYPAPDEDGIATRVAPVTGLNGEGSDGTLMQPLRKYIFFKRPGGDGLAFYQFDAARKLEGEADAARKKSRLASGVLPWADVDRDARAAGPAWFANLRKLLRDALEAWNRLGEILDQKAGRDSPPTGRVRDILQEMIAACSLYAPPEAAEAEAAPAADAQDETQETTMSGSPAGGGAPREIRETREDMLKQLVRIADFFRRNEPHSPLAYTLEDAVRRGRLTWPELLAEVLPDENARKTVLIQLGIKPQSD